MNTITTVAGLLENLRQGRMSPEELLQWLIRRGPVPPLIHKTELAKLDEALAAGLVTAELHRRVAEQLREVQAARGAASERTVINPAAAAPPAAVDATVVNPAPPAGKAPDFDLLLPDAADDAATQITAGRAPDAERTAFAATVVTPQREGGPHTGTGPRTGTGQRTGTNTSGPPSASSWERLAAKADTAPEQAVYPGMMLKERFYLEKEVGRGGMGVVYKARDERKVEAQDKNPWVAVKILNDEFRHHPQSLIALQREARKAQQLTHDNILRVYDFDKAGTIVYITMEYADGGTVKDYIKKGAAKGGWTYEEGRTVIEGMARGLARAHRDGIVHSDFKPGNVMVGEGGVPKVFDLGIARAAKTPDQKEGETTVFDAATLGALTPAYASLEMIRGEDPQIPDDVYALAISTYEVLTGRHPFDKKNAEEAMQKGMKPKRIPGLTARQWRTLEKGLAFHRKDRLQTADELIEGMRPRTWRDYALPVSIGTAAAVLVLGGVFGVLLPKLQDARVDAMIHQFEQSAFPGPTEAVAALTAMNPNDRAEVLQRGADVLQGYFFRLTDAAWDVEAKRYDFPAARAALSQARALYPDSKNVADKIDTVDAKKNELFVEFEQKLEQRVKARSIYEDQKDNAVEILALVRRIDPGSKLLNNQALLTQYGEDIRAALNARDLDIAERRVASALKVYPAQDGIKGLAAEIKALRDAQIAAARKKEQLAAFARMTPDQIRAELAALSSKPDFSADWQAQVDAAVSALGRDDAPQTAQLKAALASAFAQYVAAEAAAARYATGQSAADLGLRLFPGTPALQQEKAKLEQARRAQEAAQAALAAQGIIEDLKTKLGIVAQANNVEEAERVYAELRRRLPANDPYLTGEGAQEIGALYLRQVERFAEARRFVDAHRMAAAGTRAAPGNAELAAAERKYGVEARVAEVQAAAARPASANGAQVRAALDALKAGDSQRHDRVIADLLDTAVKNIEALIPNDRASASRGKAEWLKVFPDDARLAALVIPEGTAQPLPQEARKARRARGEDTCDKGFATYGADTRATCFDDVAGAAGPRLVVVPGVGGGKAFAITKYEITVKQFNAFCAATGKCSAGGGAETFPRTNVSLALARDYAAWLTETTGFTYRLPTEAEWTHAAGAGGRGAGEEFNCVLMQGDQQIKGGAAIAVNVGRPNPWGLINAVGNAAEWVEGGVVRGGNFNEPMSRCTVDWREAGTGAADTIGVRLVRELS